MTAIGLALSAGPLRLELAPRHGGAVAAFRLQTAEGSFDLLRPSAAGQPDALFAGCFPMVPFANCIRDNRFDFDGRSYAVTPNMPGSRLNFHGSGWQTAWQIAASGQADAELILPDGEVDQVYRYAAVQRFELTLDGLGIAMTLTNRGERTMPFSFGQHPWFPRHAGIEVRFAATAMWRADTDGQTLALEPIPEGSDYRRWRAPPDTYRNHCYAGWDGLAEIAWRQAGIGLAINADPMFRHLMFHVPPDRQEVVCLEPQTSAPCAFDSLGRGHDVPGVVILRPGETVSGGMRLSIRRLVEQHY
jgi:aldose 1-epimerase